MKARVIETGDIVEATLIRGENGKLWYDIDKSGYCLTDEELDFNFEREPDYWEKLKHQAAISAMQGILAEDWYSDSMENMCVEKAVRIATALVEKMK